MSEIYVPPEQTAVGQIIDSVILLALIYLVLLGPIILGLTAGNTITVMPEVVTWESLGQNPTMVAQWEKLGFNMEEAAEIISQRFDYTIEPIPLVLTALVIFGYFFIMLKMSDKEYREVIEEKFG